MVMQTSGSDGTTYSGTLWIELGGCRDEKSDNGQTENNVQPFCLYALFCKLQSAVNKSVAACVYWYSKIKQQYSGASK